VGAIVKTIARGLNVLVFSLAVPTFAGFVLVRFFPTLTGLSRALIVSSGPMIVLFVATIVVNWLAGNYRGYSWWDDSG
jgi:hypothetical protein